MPPTRKPPATRQRRNTPDIGDARKAKSGPPAAPHPDGKRLLVQTVNAWKEFWESDLSGLVLQADRPALARLFRMYDMRERLDRTYQKQPFSVGSTGQLVSHPAAKEIASLDSRILALEDRFGITPMARLKLGVTFGAAAKSLEAINADFNETDEDEETDPRGVINITGTEA